MHYYHYFRSHSSNRVKNARSNVRFITTKTHSFDFGAKEAHLNSDRKTAICNKFFLFFKICAEQRKHKQNTNKCLVNTNK